MNGPDCRGNEQRRCDPPGHDAGRRPVTGIAVMGIWMANSAPAWAASAEQGLTATQLMQGVAFWTAVLAIFVLVLVEFLLRRWISRVAYHWLLLVGLFVLPIFSLMGTSVVILEGTKTVNSCAACHSMDPFIHDMLSPTSETLAARHYRNRWIAEDQCYECHTTYGIHGTMKAKLGGMRHWWKYVTGSWHRPIEFLGTYPDDNCLICHAGTPKYENAWPHQQGVFEALKEGRVNCIFCHGPPHPSAEERAKWPDMGSNESAHSSGSGSAADHPPADDRSGTSATPSSSAQEGNDG